MGGQTAQRQDWSPLSKQHREPAETRTAGGSVSKDNGTTFSPVDETQNIDSVRD